MIFTLTDKKKLDNSNSVDTTNLAQLNVNNTFSGGNTFTSTNNFTNTNVFTKNQILRSNEEIGWIIQDGSNNNKCRIIKINNGNDIIIEANAGDFYWKPHGATRANNKQIKDVATPTNNNDAATKAYVDGKITTNTYNQTIDLNAEYLIPEGGTILNVQVFRKRTSDNAYMSIDVNPIGYQLGIKTNGRWFIWCNNNAVSGYSTDFKIVVTRKN